MSKFVHLHTHSHYSLLDGLPKIDELVNRTKELGMDTVALTDHGVLYGAVEFYKKARAAEIKPILGIETYVAPGDHTEKNSNGGEKYHHLILLAENQTGWKNLIQLTTKAHLDGFYYKPRVDKALLREHHEGLIALSACLAGELSRNLTAGKPAEAERATLEYQDIFGKGNFFIEIGHHPGIANYTRIQTELIALAKKTDIPVVATQDIHYLAKEDAEYHDILLAVQTGGKLADADRLTLKDDDFSMRSPDEMAALFKDHPEAIGNTVRIAARCNVSLELGKIRLPKFPLPENETSANGFLEKLIHERTSLRYPAVTPAVQERIAYELGVIEKMGFADYFLIVQDFVNWAKERGIVVGPGRGSAAGSIVSYILGITNIDPLKYGLLFERFLNPDRIQMPDIDIDITDVRRDEVLGYLRERYGEDHVANIITFGTMAARAAVRDVGRAMGVSYSFCDQLAKLIPFNHTIEEALKESEELRKLAETNEDGKRILDAAKHLEGVARHASVHACGIVITGAPLTDYLPLQRAPQDEHTIVSQFEMHAVEDLGLLKMDLLGLRNLTIIEEAIKLVSERHGNTIQTDQIPLADPKTFSLLQAADTVGVFQFESAGMQRYMKELHPTELEDLIALVALYRPGPIELIPEYVARKHKRHEVSYLHPKLEPILRNTYGIMIYQEQLMTAARTLAGFTLAEADVLRKAVGKKIRKLLMEQKDKLIQGCIKNGIPKGIAEEFWGLIEPFDRYGFNRSHAACYAMIAYHTAYLKAHYPVEFMSALLNAESREIERTAFLMNECKRMGIDVLPPDIQKSASAFMPDTTLTTPAIRFGLAAIKNVGTNIVDAIIEERGRGGPYTDLASLLSRVKHKDLNKKSLESMIKCGALDSLGVERNKALQNIDELLKFATSARREGQTAQTGLFGAKLGSGTRKLADAPPATAQEKLTWEKELLGLYVTDHPLNQHKTRIELVKAQPIRDILKGATDRKPARAAGVVGEIKRIVTKTGKPMLFAKIADFGDTLEVVVFPDILANQLNVWRENNSILVAGRMSLKNGEPKLICDDAKEL